MTFKSNLCDFLEIFVYTFCIIFMSMHNICILQNNTYATCPPHTHTYTQRYDFQDLRSKVMGGLDRPEGMQQDSFVPKNIQCPQKPRGRKKTKVPKEQVPEPPKFVRPSAAACGFSTVGMTDEEVQKKLQDLNLIPADEAGDTQTKRSKKRVKAVEGEKVGGEEQEEGIKTKRQKGSKVDEQEGSRSSRVEEQPKRKREMKQSHETKTDQLDKKLRKMKNGDVPKHTPCGSKASGSAGSAGEVFKDKGKKNKGKKDKGKEEGKANEKEAATTNTEAELTDAEKAKAARQAEAKARVSRKSSAYHTAVRAARLAGKSKEEQTAAGKAVPCLIE